MLKAGRQVVGRHDMSYKGSGIGSDDSHARGEYHKDGHDGEHAQNLGQDKVARRVDAHDVQRVNLLCHTHGTQF